MNQRYINLKHSQGNFFTDIDNNVVLDLNCPMPLGYNSDRLVFNRMGTNVYDAHLQGRADLTNLPPAEFDDMLRDLVMPVAPDGATQVHLADDRCSANEQALSVALFKYAVQHKRDYKSLSVMGVAHGSHGNSIAAISASDVANKAYDWPTAPLPEVQYPYNHFERDNIAEENRCIEVAKKIINQRRAAGKDVGAIIVEPITANGYRMAAPTYYKKLRKVAADEGIPFIVDETTIGMGVSAKMWSHEYWYLSERDGGCADIVTFSGNTGISGFFSTSEYRTDPMCCAFEQNVDMVKLINFGETQ